MLPTALERKDAQGLDCGCMTRPALPQLIAALLPPCCYAGRQEGKDGRIVPVYKVKAWRVPDEDGIDRQAKPSLH